MVGVNDTISKDQIFELKLDVATRKFEKVIQELKLVTGNGRFGITPIKMDKIVFWCQN